MTNPTQKRDAQLLFAANMKGIRLSKKLTQEKVAEYAGLHPNYISSVERGERNISICNIERIAHALGVPMHALLQGELDVGNLVDAGAIEEPRPEQGKSK
jgi:transcriptional regulator with XRE-family HTH domain